jgi:arabinose-5-phosphate isomerase
MRSAPTLALETNALTVARRVLHCEAATLRDVADRLDGSFVAATELLLQCTGRIALTGVGKSFDVAGKIAGTFNSTGARAYLLDPTKAMHGDLGMVHGNDIVLALSHSGNSEELVRLLNPLADLAQALIAITGRPDGALAQWADVAIVYGDVEESGPLAMAPTTSTTVMMALGDALAAALAEQRQFSAEDFARYHPAGTLGLKLAKVEQFMRTGDDLRIAPATSSVRDVFVNGSHHRRRTGAVVLIDADGRLSGLFTDSDLARLFEHRADAALDGPVSAVMTRQPLTVMVGTKVGAALDIMKSRKISELPVIDGDHRPVGLLDITDLIGLPIRSETHRASAGVRRRASA